MDLTDPTTWETPGTNAGDPYRYPVADPRAVEGYTIPSYESAMEDKEVQLVPETGTPDKFLRDDLTEPFPQDVFDEHLHRFFTAYATDYDTYGQAVALSGAPGGSAIAVGGPGVIYGFSLANPSTVTPLFLTLYRGIDSTAIPILYLTVPVASDATHPGVLNVNLGTNGLGFSGLLSYTATAQFSGTIVVRHKVAL